MLLITGAKLRLRKADGSFEKVEVRKGHEHRRYLRGNHEPLPDRCSTAYYLRRFYKRETEDALIDLNFLTLITCW